jgi:hypothetical protein
MFADGERMAAPLITCGHTLRHGVCALVAETPGGGADTGILDTDLKKLINDLADATEEKMSDLRSSSTKRRSVLMVFGDTRRERRLRRGSVRLRRRSVRVRLL